MCATGARFAPHFYWGFAMRIKSNQGNATLTLPTKRIITKTRQSKTVVLKRNKIEGVFVPSVIAPMPELRKGWIGRRVQGGHSPVPYRSRSADWGMANKRARA